MTTAYVYPHEVRLHVHQVVAGRLAEAPVVLAAAGTLTAGQMTTRFASRNGEPAPVRFAATDDRPIGLKVVFVPSGSAELELPTDARPPSGEYYVGLRMGHDHVVELVLQHVATQMPWSYRVGALPGDPAEANI